jgi:hypothetical protein
MPPDDAKSILIDLIRNGVVTPAEVAKHQAISPQAVHRWISAEFAKQARARVAGLIIEAALHPERQERRQGRPNQKEKQTMRVIAQKNPKRTIALANIKSGKMTVPQAAKFAGAPVSGIVGWCRLAKIALPAEYDNRRHRDVANLEQIIQIASTIPH